MLLNHTPSPRQRARSGNRPPAPHYLTYTTTDQTHTTLSPRAGSREDFLLLGTRRMELYYHHYQHSRLIPGHRTRAYDWCSSNRGLGFMILFILDWHCFFFTLLFECHRCLERRSHADMSSDIEGFCVRADTHGDLRLEWRPEQAGFDDLHTKTYTHPLLCDVAIVGLMASKEAYVGLRHGISKQISNCTMKTLLHKHDLLVPHLCTRLE